MYFRGGFIQRGGLADAEGVVGVAVGQCRDAGIDAAVRDVGDGEELGEAPLKWVSEMRLPATRSYRSFSALCMAMFIRFTTFPFFNHFGIDLRRPYS